MSVNQMWASLKLRATAIVATLGMSLAGQVAADSSLHKYSVYQKDQAFNPGELAVKRGEIVQIVNDDGELLHHACIESKTFNFDSGDQEPGSKVDITFSVPGSFTVLCGIHPKMRLHVRVE